MNLGIVRLEDTGIPARNDILLLFNISNIKHVTVSSLGRQRRPADARQRRSILQHELPCFPASLSLLPQRVQFHHRLDPSHTTPLDTSTQLTSQALIL